MIQEKKTSGKFTGLGGLFLLCLCTVFCLLADMSVEAATSGNWEYEILGDGTVVPPHTHTYKKTTTKATAKKNGAIVTKCSICGEEKSTTTIYAASGIKLSRTSFTYNGKKQKPTIIVKNSNGQKLSAGSYKITYPKNSKSIGKYTVTVKLKGNYTGTVKLTYRIAPKSTSISKLTAQKKGFTVKWKKQTRQTTGYQLQYSTSSKFKGAKAVNVGKNKTTSKSITKLNGGKKYYVRIRTYKTVKVNGRNVKVYSGWSKAKSVKTKKGVTHSDTTGNLTITFRGTYMQSTARSMLSMINDFRTGNQAWVWNETNTKKISCTRLGTLTYDYELEKVAMQRAAELVALYGHTRPDGSECFTAYTNTYINTSIGENIAIGTNFDATSVFKAWREDAEPYSGQGHRRNMLDSSFSAVGIAHVYYKGCHYWVQEFSSKVGSNVYTAPNNKECDMTVSIAPSYVASDALRPEYDSQRLSVRESAAFPKVYHVINIPRLAKWVPVLEYEVYPQWSVTSGSSVISVSSKGYTGIAEGKAVLTGTYGNKKININVSVANSQLQANRQR